MTGLIEELKKEHRDIERLLAKVKEPNVNHKEARSMLIQAHASLVAHLKKEDAQLYPALRKAGLADEKLRTALEFYAKDMEQITLDAVEFFKKYACTDAEIGLPFAKDLGRIIGAISTRMRNEERSIYSEYEKLQR